MRAVQRLESHDECWRWRRFFKDPSLWRDYRQCKEEPSSPDFVHESTGEALWIDRSSCWLELKLSNLEGFSGAGTRARYKRNDQQSSGDGAAQKNATLAATLSSIITKVEGRTEALELYERARRDGRVPPVSVSLAALKSCIGSKDLTTGRRIHSEVADNQQELHTHVANTLVDMYAKCGSMAEARRVFDAIKLHSVVSWNAIIMGYASNGDGAQALELFSAMQRKGFVPDSRIFIAALKACTDLATKEEGTLVGEKMIKLECLERGREIHLELAKRGHEGDLYVASTLVDFYAKCGSMADARKVFDKMERYDVVSWTAMILGYAASGQGELGLELYSRMLREGFKPDSRIFVAAVKACGSVASQDERMDWQKKWLEKGVAIHAQVAKAGCENNIYVAASLVDMYAKCGSLENARRVFERVRQRNVVHWNSIIAAYAQGGQEEVAMELYESMKAQGFVSDARTTVVTLAACAALAGKEEGKESGGVIIKGTSLEKGRALHLEAVKNRHDKDVYVASTLVDFYAKCGCMADARQVFDEMEQHSSASWQAIISGYAHNGKEDTALELFERMKAKGGVVPSGRHYIAAIKACGGLAALEVGRKTHEEIREAGYEDDIMVTNSLIHFYGKCGAMASAQEVFDKARTKSLVTWNALIAGYTHQGDTAKTFELFEGMEKEKVLPNEITFLHVLNACTHAGLVEKGKEIFEAMREKFSPAREHYTCMVDLLGRANHLEEALAMVKSMPFKPDPALWRAVLGACQKWSNAKVGRIAFESLLELDEGDATAYVLLANIYSGAKMLDESAKIQTMRRSRGAS
ncbi:pentatricopeptide repeat-containing protein At4g18520, chloroplastic-like [Selaginella moellendorffii]|uniref:pentatricopeptide repeat-containing protein At4g18520, chloroplastic-like n=1 Tax=Selaginella moellendorffii TaxID=88036 RepID=UPI000D1C4593|nr:pentatricopeptide repeat-containing protein At4g18520, chloroplastic-like [Selaginella moellendorffii]|eukprot:XP_024528831.1 pentatricopeptide repeat-containing protein At4g18520, chloroplastic-like [Selaginella moellendorffii]